MSKGLGSSEVLTHGVMYVLLGLGILILFGILILGPILFFLG